MSSDVQEYLKCIADDLHTSVKKDIDMRKLGLLFYGHFSLQSPIDKLERSTGKDDINIPVLGYP